MGESRASGQYAEVEVVEVEVEVDETGNERELTPDRLPRSEKNETIYDGEKSNTIYDGEESGASPAAEGSSPAAEGESETGTGGTERDGTIYDG